MSMKLSIGDSSAKVTTFLVLRGTLIATILLGGLLVLYDGIVRSIWLESQTLVIISVFSYLLLAEVLLRKGFERIVNYLLIGFYISLAFSTLLLWGLNAPVGILTISFAVLLPSILIGAKSIMPVAIVCVAILSCVQLAHTNGILSPNLENLSLKSTYWDVAAYSTILSIFALVSWLAGSQRESNLERALSAEKALKAQKDIISNELEKESSALRLAQLNQIRHLHKFALLGQSTAATLHDLSNHLSILNLDIDDLRQQNSNSKAINNAKGSITHINKMVRQARQQLNSYDQVESFNALLVINQCIKDVNQKFKYCKVSLIKKSNSSNKPFYITGNSLALMQIVAILLNNALDACKESSSPKIFVEIKSTKSKLYLSVMDNGPGVPKNIIQKIFSPVTSTKDSGLGVGLYIAQNLAKEQFNGKISLKPSENGAHFLVTIPRKNLLN